MDTFTWSTEKDFGTEWAEDDVKKVNFGQGVVQLQKQTLTAPKRTFTLTFRDYPATITDITNFLVSHTGQRFFWYHPLTGEQIIVWSNKFSKTDSGVVDTFSATFYEEFY